ncbi:MAG TPA: hypothetical protein VFA60_12755 [Terriglobales bacterium]|nr:hypothetical protein [Terriglobales bacterium]
MNTRLLRRRILALIIVCLVVDAAAAVFLMTPIAGSRASRQQEFERVRKEWQDQLHKTLPLRDIDKKLVEAGDQVDSFLRARVPARDSAVVAELGQLAKENGVRFSAVRYNSGDAPIDGLRRLEIDAAVAGDYLKVVKFINALERDRMFFIVDSVALAEQQGGAVRLELKLESYVRSAEAATQASNATGDGQPSGLSDDATGVAAPENADASKGDRKSNQSAPRKQVTPRPSTGK